MPDQHNTRSAILRTVLVSMGLAAATATANHAGQLGIPAWAAALVAALASGAAVILTQPDHR